MGDKLIDGKLTYSFKGKADSELKQAVRDGIKEWDDKIASLQFVEISGTDKQEQHPDIQLKFRKDGDEIAGITITNFNNLDLLTITSSPYQKVHLATHLIAKL